MLPFCTTVCPIQTLLSFNAVEAGWVVLVFCSKLFSSFPLESEDAFRLDYKKTVNNLLLNPQNDHTCYNRRSKDWCNNFVLRRSMWAEPSHKRFNCANMPIAFRECRHACGYCRLNQDETDIANYDYALATDPISCHNPSYGLAYHKVDFKKGL